MKKDRAVSFLWSCVFSLTMSLSAVMCLVSAFRLGVDTAQLTVFCVIASFVCSLSYTLPLALLPVGVSALALGYLWRDGTLMLSLEALLNRLTRQYNKAYNWGIIRWGYRTADEMEPTMITVLCILAALVVMATAWSVCRRKSASYPLLSIVFVGACFVVNDTVPDTIWIYLLLASTVSLLLTASVRRQDENRGNRTCLLIAPLTALGVLLLLWAAPRESYSQRANAQKLSDAIFGENASQLLMSSVEQVSSTVEMTDANRVDLTTVGYRTEYEATVLTVTAPFTGTLYLRGRAMDTYDGTGWTASGKSDLPWPSTGLHNMGEVQISTRFGHRMLYTPYYTNYGELKDIASGVQNEKSLTQYSFSYFQLPKGVTPAMMALASSAYDPADLSESVHLEPSVRTWAESVVRKITDDAVSFTEKAERIASYVRNSASYSLYTPRMPDKETDFARWFLEKSDIGYCVHFATTATVLLQAAGVPARYVTGYLVQVQEGQRVEVASKQAHAWAEYYLPNFGWVILETTPAMLVPVQTEPAETSATETVLPTETQTNVTDATTVTVPWVPSITHTQPSVWPKVMACVVMLVLLAAVAVQSRVRLVYRRKREKRAEPNARALLHWQETVQLAQLAKTAPPKELLSIAQLAKFSQHTVTEEQLGQLVSFRENTVAQLKTHSLWRRLYYRLILAIY